MSIITLRRTAISVFITKKPIKNINLRINRNGMVKASVPIRCSMKYVEEFLNAKEVWIDTHLKKIKARQQPMLDATQSNEILYLGKKYPVKIHEDHTSSRIQLEVNHLDFFVKSSPSSIKQQQLIQQWQRRQMEMLIPDLILKWEPIIGVEVAEWYIRTMRSRWGSCNVLKRKICLNFELIKRPLACLEYVLVHEMVHLLEASHNQRFYAFMSQFMPEWKNCKRLLNGMPIAG